ncbi:MAG: hypothetical protein ABJB03_04835 [Rhodoglobus sp.]
MTGSPVEGGPRIPGASAYTWISRLLRVWTFAFLPLALILVLRVTNQFEDGAPWHWAGPVAIGLVIVEVVVMGVAYFIGMGKRRAEQRNGYTTFPSPPLTLEQRHPVYDVVIRKPNDPALGAAFDTIVKQVTAEQVPLAPRT